MLTDAYGIKTTESFKLFYCVYGVRGFTDIYGIKLTGSSKIFILSLWELGEELARFADF